VTAAHLACLADNDDALPQLLVRRVPAHSLKVAWKEDDVLKNRDFDYSKRFLPNQLAGVDEIACFDEDEKPS
jgi:hypothetical protein